MTAPATLWDQYEKAITDCPGYTQEQRKAVLWLNNLGRSENMTLAALGDAIDYSPTVVQRILSGTYGAGTDKVITSIYRYKSLYEARKEAGDRPPLCADQHGSADMGRGRLCSRAATNCFRDWPDPARQDNGDS